MRLCLLKVKKVRRRFTRSERQRHGFLRHPHTHERVAAGAHLRRTDTHVHATLSLQRKFREKRVESEMVLDIDAEGER